MTENLPYSRSSFSSGGVKESFAWKIPNISSMPQEVDYVVQSPPFYLDGIPFILKMYPNGQTMYRSTGFIDVVVENLSSQVKNKFSIEITCIDAFGKSIKHCNRWIDSSLLNTEIKMFTFMPNLKNCPEKWRITPNDTLTLICGITNCVLVIENQNSSIISTTHSIDKITTCQSKKQKCDVLKDEDENNTAPGGVDVNHASTCSATIKDEMPTHQSKKLKCDILQNEDENNTASGSIDVNDVATGNAFKGFGFGTTSSNTLPSISFGAPSASTVSTNFAFGAQAATSLASSSFNFGTIAPTTTSTGFSFGMPAVSSAGNTGFTTPPLPSTVSFSFGPATTTTTSGFTFGASVPSTTSTFSFGASVPSNTSRFSFRDPSNAQQSSGLTFGVPTAVSKTVKSYRNYGNPVVGKLFKDYGIHKYQWKICYIKPVPIGYHIQSEQFTFADAIWILRVYPYCRMVHLNESSIEVVLERLQSRIPEHYIVLEFQTPETFQGSLFFNAHYKRGDPVKFRFPQEEKRDGIGDEDKQCIHMEFKMKMKRLFGFDSQTTLTKTIVVDDKLSGSGYSARLQNNRILHNFKKLYLNKEDCDVIIKVKGQEFPAHKLVLKAQSPVFDSAFRVDMKEKATGVVDVEDCDPSTFSDFLCFLYCGEVENLTLNNVSNLFTTADKYDVPFLKSTCLEFMKQELTIDTFCDIFALALQHSECELIKFCTDFFVQHFVQIIMTTKWQSFIIENPMQGNNLIIKAVVPSKK